MSTSTEAGRHHGTELPSVVIAGRPNVGKSTLFNRLLKRRRAITDASPGVTRDVVSERWSCDGIEAVLSDTGGVASSGDEFRELVSERALAAVKAAGCILLVVDVTEITGEDEELMERLRPYAQKTLLVANKVDSEKREALSYDLYRYGYSEIVSISAEHARGMDALYAALRARLAEAVEASERTDSDVAAEAAAQTPIRIAILGKPNTGKSTLANALTFSENSIVSELPGTTRDTVAAQFTESGTTYQLLDTAGIRRKNKVSEAVEYYSVNRAIKALEECDVVHLVIEAPESVTEQDKKIARLAVDRGRAVTIVLNKWDLMADIGNVFNAVADRIRHVFPVLHFAPIVAVSAKNRSGLTKLLETTRAQFEQLNHRVDTGPLNRALQRWLEETPPPTVNNRRLKIRYITQAKTNPVMFVLFANRAKGIPENFLNYIKNRIRAELGFSDIPVRLEVRHQARS